MIDFLDICIVYIWIIIVKNILNIFELIIYKHFKFSKLVENIENSLQYCSYFFILFYVLLFPFLKFI